MLCRPSCEGLSCRESSSRKLLRPNLQSLRFSKFVLDEQSGRRTTDASALCEESMRQRKFKSEGSVSAVGRVHAAIRPREVSSEQPSEGTWTEGKKFNWFKNWWPVQAVYNLKTDRPNKIQLLGRDYVVWKGQSGEWIAMDDQCPHRMAPLSEGRIENDGNLLCSYHAWRFNECGKCVKIPHAESEVAHSVACNSPRSSVQTYPCKARGTILWIWPDNSIVAEKDSEESPIPMDEELANELENHEHRGTATPYVRHLPYSFDILMENLTDPSHLAVSHHRLTPSLDRYKAKPLYAQYCTTLRANPDAIAMTYFPVRAGHKTQCELQVPGIVTYYEHFKDGNPTSTVFLGASPMKPGWSILTTTGIGKDSKSTKKAPNFFQTDPSFLKEVQRHFFLNELFDGDLVFLHEQDKRIQSRGSNFKAINTYNAPTSADLLMLAFRKWFENEGQHGAAYGGDKPLLQVEELSREQLLNRYEQHTKHCNLCSDALNTVQTMIAVFKTLSWAALLIGTFFVARKVASSSVSILPLAKNVGVFFCFAAFALSVGAKYFLEKKILPQFYFIDHVHADKN